jgi:ElaB/YqjD/DUF883 family membrane-anchored ribosome-binding protein
MPVQPQKPRVLLDWFTVSYRSVVLGILLLVVALAGAGWYAFFYAKGKPREEAQEAISRAETRLAEAGRYPASDHLDEVRGSARSALTEGKDAFQRRQYDDARVAAIRSENFSQKAIDMARADNLTVRQLAQRLGGFSGDLHRHLSLPRRQHRDLHAERRLHGHQICGARHRSDRELLLRGRW